MIYLDGFSGTGGFHKGFADADQYFTKVYFSEINKRAIANYKYNFKNSIHVGSIKNLRKGDIKEEIDLFTFGFPCQDISIFGLRKGLRGSESSLFFEALRIIKEYEPRVFIFENVKNLLSCNKGEDFQIILQEIANIGLYDCEWQLLNTNWILPQHRSRLFFIGHHCEKSSPKVFPIHSNCKEGTTTDSQQRSEKRQTNHIFQTLTTDPTSLGFGANLVKEKDGSYRYLTNIEYERLQGFPDDWTKYGVFHNQVKELSRTARWELIGNAVSPPIVKLISNKLFSKN